MDYAQVPGPDGSDVRVPISDEYRRCSICGGDCEPEPTALDGIGVRIVFVCPSHGPQSVVDPFEDSR